MTMIFVWAYIIPRKHGSQSRLIMVVYPPIIFTIQLRQPIFSRNLMAALGYFCSSPVR
jgi:hypothetical protein